MEKQEEFYKVGTIVNTHGIRGEVKIASITDFAEQRFAKKAVLYVEDKGQKVKQTVASSRIHKGMFLVTFAGVDNINQIEHLKTHDVYVLASDRAEQLDEGQYYFDQIMGAKVVDEDNIELGTVTDIMNLYANDVWEVTLLNGKKALIPIIDDVLKNVDTATRIVTIHVLEGMLD